MKKLVLLRRTSQAACLLLFIYVLWATTYPLQSPFSSQALFLLDPLIMGFTALSERLLLPGLGVALGMLVLTMVLGRFFCGWMCPMGAMVDLAGKLRRSPGHGLNPRHTRMARVPKFIVLGGIFLLAMAGAQWAWVLDPVVTMARVVSFNLIPSVTLVVDTFFRSLIQQFGLYGATYDLYRSLKEGLLGVNVHFFANSWDTLMFFVVLMLASVLVLRLWCRMLCPLGACYALAARPSLLERRVSRCTSCGRCARGCRMGAIGQGLDYRKEECVLCMDCVYHCPAKATRFTWRWHATPLEQRADKGITRGQFLSLCGGMMAFLGMGKGMAEAGDGHAAGHPVIRPPGVLPEKRFVNTCVRCGNCMKVCITNVLQPALFDAGAEGVWTPRMVPEIGYCEYNCKLCGEVCPTGAITRLSLPEKKAWKVGLAAIDRSLCISWKGQKDCIVCEEHCPIPQKAITMKEVSFEGVMMSRPHVDKDRCIGCGICQNKCPVLPVRAIKVDPAILEEGP